MSFEVRFFNFPKRENSTALPDITGGAVFECVLKEDCSLNRPQILLDFNDMEAWPDYNYCYVKPWNKFFFIEDWINEHPVWRAMCAIDALASYRSEILASTQYVAYSSVHGDTWLADTRIPVLKSTTVSSESAALPFFLSGGWYILSVIGKSGSCLYALSLSYLRQLISSIDGNNDNFETVAENRAQQFLQGGANPLSAEDMLGFGTLMTQNDMLGKAYGNAPNCIRSCLFVPFAITGVTSEKIWLGNYNTGVDGTVIDSTPITGSVSVSIPWHFSDWRRGYCEQVYLYLPLVGMVSVSADAITHASSITVNYSYTITDGTVAYQVVCGGEIIGSYGGSCAINYPLGINQQASAGQVMQSVIQGLTSAVSAGITGNVAGAVAGVAATAYNALDVSLTSHPSCVGGIGGGAGAGLSHSVTCYTVAHNTIVDPSTMASTMGMPTMKPLQLSSCSGYCECVNAHVAANASLEELNMITAWLNSGFYIE